MEKIRPQHEFIEKPWGYEIIWIRTDKYVGKILHINEGASLSLQYHRVKKESMFVIEGKVKVILRDGNDYQELELGPGESVHIPPGVVHRFIARTPCRIIEISTPEIDDVVRLKDEYGRE